MAAIVLAVPLYGKGAVTPAEEALVKATVQNTYGARSLHPSVVSMLTKGNPDREGPIAYQILREILLTEHTLGQHYTNLATGRYSNYLVHVLPETTPYLKEQMAQIDTCWAKRVPLDEALYSLMDDIYSNRDSNTIFGFPAMTGGDIEIDQLPSLETKATTTFAVAPQVQTAMGLLSVVTAIVVLDANYTYYGHIYASPWNKAGGMGAIGIRTSMSNLVCRTMTGIAEKLFRGMLTWGATHEYNHVRVLAPFRNVQPQLLKLGFSFDQPNEPILYYAGPAKNIEVKEYGVYFTKLLEPIFSSAEFELDAVSYDDQYDLIPEAAASHLRFKILSDPYSIVTATSKE